MRALAGGVHRDLLLGERPLGMPGHHPVDDVGVVHRHPDMRLHDVVVDIRGRHGVEGQQVLRDAPVRLPVGLAALGADENAVVGVHHLEARRLVSRLHRRAHPEARAVHVLRDRAVGVPDGRVEERDMAGVDTAFQGLEPVAVLDALGDEEVALRQERPLELGQGRRRALRAHVGPDHPAGLRARIGRGAHLGREARLRRLARHVHALPVQPELPAVIRAAHPAVLVPPEVERGPAVRAELGDEAGPALGGAMRDQPLAEQRDPLDPAAGGSSADCTTGIQ